MRPYSTAPDWVNTSSSVFLNSGGSSFFVSIDPTKLDDNSANYAEVKGYDVSNVAAGPLFRYTLCTATSSRFLHDRIKKVLLVS